MLFNYSTSSSGSSYRSNIYSRMCNCNKISWSRRFGSSTNIDRSNLTVHKSSSSKVNNKSSKSSRNSRNSRNSVYRRNIKIRM